MLIGSDLAQGIVPAAEPAVFRTQGVMRPRDLELRPFTFQYDNNTAVYFRRFTDTSWQEEQVKVKDKAALFNILNEQSADVVALGDTQGEKDHLLESKISYPVVYRGNTGRDARSGGFFECTMKTRPGPLSLQATYWGEERDRRFTILVDGIVVASEQLNGTGPTDFIEREYPVPEALTQGKPTVRVRFEPQKRATAGPVFGLRLHAVGT